MKVALPAEAVLAFVLHHPPDEQYQLRGGGEQPTVTPSGTRARCLWQRANAAVLAR